MDPMTIAALAGGGLQLVTGLLGQDAANKKAREAQAQFDNLKLPDVEKMKLLLEEYALQGQITPEQYQALTQGDTALAGVSTDPRIRQAQFDALESLQQQAKEGFSPADLAGFELSRRQAANESQAKQGQILQEMQARGQGGSGAELIARLQGAESGADRLAEEGMKRAQLMQQARRDAITGAANQAGSLRGQEYTQDANLASSRDNIARFNLQNQQGSLDRNVAARNEAQRMNLAEKQNIANQNVGLRNQQQQYNKQLAQQDYNNRFGLASAKAGALTGAANRIDQQTANTVGGIGSLASGIGGAFGSSKPTTGVTGSTGSTFGGLTSSGGEFDLTKKFGNF